MSVERKDGSAVWRVRWRQAGRNRSKVLGRKRDADGVGSASIRKALVLLQGVLQRACEWGRLASNPS